MSTTSTGWGEEVLPGVYLQRGVRSSAINEDSNYNVIRDSLQANRNTIADSEAANMRRIHDLIGRYSSEIEKLQNSNRFMLRFLAKAEQSSKKSDAIFQCAYKSDSEDDYECEEDEEFDISASDDNNVIEEAIISNKDIIKEKAEELQLLLKVVSASSPYLKDDLVSMDMCNFSHCRSTTPNYHVKESSGIDVPGDIHTNLDINEVYDSSMNCNSTLDEMPCSVDQLVKSNDDMRTPSTAFPNMPLLPSTQFAL